METKIKTQKEMLIAKLNSAIAAADAPAGVTYSIEDAGDKIFLTAAYSEEHQYTDEPMDALGSVVDGKSGLLTNDDRGTVYQSFTYPVTE